jgi:hypothetical protein
MEDKLLQQLKELQHIHDNMDVKSITPEKIEEILSKLETVVDDSEKTLNNLVTKINDNEETVHNTQG